MSNLEEKKYGPEEPLEEAKPEQEPESHTQEPDPEPEPEQPQVLKDPNTGQPLRDQDPGVPDSKWVGKHGIADIDNKDITDRKEQRKIEQDFGD